MKVTKLLGNRVLIRPEEVETKTKSGLVVSMDNYKAHPRYGEVIAVGPGKESTEYSKEGQAMSVAVGDQIRFSFVGCDEVEHDGESLIVIPEDQVIAIVE